MTGQERIQQLYMTVPSLEVLYKTRVRHYTIQAHTINVFNQFGIYFSSNFNKIDIETFRLLLLLHDIGKPLAHQRRNRNQQHLETINIISKYKEELNISNENLVLFKALLSNDSLGMYMQEKISVETACNVISETSKQVDLDLRSFFYLLSVYYQCDVASYTEDAGGLKYLEYLFEYRDKDKVFNHTNGLLQFSVKYQHKYEQLFGQLIGEENIKQAAPLQEYSNIKYIQGNIFNSKLQTIVNTVNCVGVMGKGIALVFKLRYPKMFETYSEHCENKLIEVGKLWLYKEENDAPWVLNFPTKLHWKYPSKIEYIQKGLSKFVETYRNRGVTSVAFPLLGAHNGGLDKQEVLAVMTHYLGQCDIPIEIYEYDPLAPDDLFKKFKEKWNLIPVEARKEVTGIRTQKQIDTIDKAINSSSVQSMIALIEYDGIGIKTMDKCFKIVTSSISSKTLF